MTASYLMMCHQSNLMLEFENNLHITFCGLPLLAGIPSTDSLVYAHIVTEVKKNKAKSAFLDITLQRRKVM